MEHTARQLRGHRGNRQSAWAAWSLAAAIVCACIGFGCTVTESNYKMLSFFFDGVPDPSAVPKASSADGTLSVQVVVHKPYAEEKCEACHKTQYKPSRNNPAICLECHKEIGSEHRWVHGAVAGGACLWCHSPHESARKWLLRGPDRKVCAQCHAASMTEKSPVLAHSDPNASCIACHNGHGGDDSLMLKPGASAAGPPADGAPAVSPASTESPASNSTEGLKPAPKPVSTPADVPAPAPTPPTESAPAGRDG